MKRAIAPGTAGVMLANGRVLPVLVRRVYPDGSCEATNLNTGGRVSGRLAGTAPKKGGMG